MTSPLHKSPLGIMGAFALKVLGKNPDKFGDVVTPGFDAMDHYLANELEVVSSSETITGPATAATVVHTVPQGQMWRVLNWGFTSVFAAGDIAITAFAGVHIASQGAVLAVATEPTIAMSGSTTLTKLAAYYAPRPLLLPAGWSLYAQMRMATAPGTPTVFAFGMVLQRIRE